jgi:hypothetical protein
VSNSTPVDGNGSSGRTTSYDTNYLDFLDDEISDLVNNATVGDSSEASLTRDQKAIMDYVGEALARLGRVKRVALGVKEKEAFVRSWTRSKNR